MAKAKPSVDPKGRWKTIRPLPESGQGWIFLVKDSTDVLRGEFVRKVLKSNARNFRFRREVAVTNALHKDGCSVVPVVDHFFPEQADEYSYYVTPLYRRGDLRHLITAGYFRDNFNKSITFLDLLYRALCDVHQTAAHRDLKPENVLIDHEFRPVLCDFGLCMELNDAESPVRTDMLEQIGSRHYIAPEALSGRYAVTNPLALDFYSFGKICYEVVVSRTLPGLSKPEGAHDLTRDLSDPTIALLNALITDLLSDDVPSRERAWMSVSRVFQMLLNPRTDSPGTEPDVLEHQIRVRLASSKMIRAARDKENLAVRKSQFVDRLCAAIHARLASDPIVQRLSAIATEPGCGFSLTCQRQIPDILPKLQNLLLRPLSFGDIDEVSSGVPQLTVRWQSTKLPVVSLSVRITTHRVTDRITCHIVLFRAKQILNLWPSLEHPITEFIEGTVGDELFIGLIVKAIGEFIPRWVDLFRMTMPPE